ncbi:MAG: ATP-binding cassette domain-containing protein [Puia sp.]
MFSHKETFSNVEKAQSLHDIHLQIVRGKRIALIGESGSGKSTLMALLRGALRCATGSEIKVDGVNTEVASIAETITLFPQEPEIFENTIEHNITLGLPL